MPEAKADIMITTSHPRFGIPKSRTFSVLSSLTQSFSRGSLASRGAGSRNVSGESYASNSAVPVPGVAHESSFQQTRQLHDGAPSTSTTSALLPNPGLPDNPKAITTAMPPQYWAGRFMALHDRFHNELLEPHHLARICEAQAQSPLPDFGSRPPAAAQNNPSTSVYALARLGRTAKHIPSQHSSPRQPSRIPQSATTGAILQSTSYNVTSHLQLAHPPSLNKRGTAQPLPTIPANNKKKPDPISLSTTTTAVPTTIKDPSPLPDDNALTRRALLHLSQQCVTPAARASLVAWQVSYAGRTGRACFLPASTTTTASCCRSTSSATTAACSPALTATTGAATAVAAASSAVGASGNGVAASADGAAAVGDGAAAGADGDDERGVGVGSYFVEGVTLPVVVEKEVLMRGGDKIGFIDSKASGMGCIYNKDNNIDSTSGVGCIHKNNNIVDSNTSGVCGPSCEGGGGQEKEQGGKQAPPEQQDSREFGRRGREIVRRLQRRLGSKTKSEASGHHAVADDRMDRIASDGWSGVQGQGKGSTASSEGGGGLSEKGFRVEEKEKGRKGGRFGFFMG